MHAGTAVAVAESRRHVSNGPKCQELGWVCVPLAIVIYDNWGREAHVTFSNLASQNLPFGPGQGPAVLAVFVKF